MSGPRRTFAGSPIMMTHWDPGMYPDKPIPLIQELVVNILAYGHVELKDVDLFMNEEIVSYLSQPPIDGISNWDLFVSLVRTKRVTVLTPDKGRRLSEKTPLYSAARDHARKRGHAGQRWLKFDEERKAYCQKLDKLLIPENACRPRQAPPRNRNSFAETMYDILTDENTEWRQRDAFRHISADNAKLIASFCAEPQKAIEFLQARGDTDIVNRDQGFFRTRLYQCTGKLANDWERWSFENLAQTVYFANELNREDAAGSYSGRLVECPNPYVPATAPPTVNVVVEPQLSPGCLDVFLTPDLGDVLNETLAETGSVMRDFWKAAQRSQDPDKEFGRAWGSVAEEFARANAKRADERRRQQSSHVHWEKLVNVIRCAHLRTGLASWGLKLVVGSLPGDWQEPLRQLTERTDVGLMLAANILESPGVQLVGPAVEDWIRSGVMEARMLPKTRNALLGAAAVRSAVAPIPIGDAARRSATHRSEDSDSLG